ncbi:hypothetical protein NOR_07788 [Metarhizium rileyi]|uniref:Uncharacterized protein n=1 Tax=Metarhizium rileyi (strain RCEF 4871) TaxID=1649241 RepID=A0A166XG01_METRR|nr:hypothetical protein NOR_07788 [Metarhizium rileyi RCEF 4871]
MARAHPTPAGPTPTPPPDDDNDDIKLATLGKQTAPPSPPSPLPLRPRPHRQHPPPPSSGPSRSESPIRPLTEALFNRQSLGKDEQQRNMAYQWTRQEKFKRGVWSVAVAAVICVGTITGAQLKSDNQKGQQIKQFRETSTADQVAILEAQREHLVQQKLGLERKLHMFRERARERDDNKGSGK